MTGLGQAEFAQRRRQLMDAMEPGSIALVPGAVMQRRNRDIDYACLLYTSLSPRDRTRSRMPSSA